MPPLALPSIMPPLIDVCRAPPHTRPHICRMWVFPRTPLPGLYFQRINGFLNAGCRGGAGSLPSLPAWGVACGPGAAACAGGPCAGSAFLVACFAPVALSLVGRLGLAICFLLCYPILWLLVSFLFRPFGLGGV